MSAPGVGDSNYKLRSSSRFNSHLKWTLLIGSAAALLFLGTCGRSQYHLYKLVSNAVSRFHGQLDQAEYEEIYGDATDQFRNSGSRQDAIAFLRNVHEKMGSSKKFSIRGLNTAKSFNYKTGARETFVTAVYLTNFTEGEATESFVWRIDPDQPRVWNYRIESPNLR
jgi:hypothetical protein